MAGTVSRQTAASLLVVLMALGAVVLWAGIPVAWLWLASQMHPNEAQTRFDQHVVVIVGMPITMVIWARLLIALDFLHARITRRPLPTRRREAWMRSMRDEAEVRDPGSPLALILVGSAMLVIVGMAVWFFAFAGSPLPGG